MVLSICGIALTAIAPSASAEELPTPVPTVLPSSRYSIAPPKVVGSVRVGGQVLCKEGKWKWPAVNGTPTDWFLLYPDGTRVQAMSGRSRATIPANAVGLRVQCRQTPILARHLDFGDTVSAEAWSRPRTIT